MADKLPLRYARKEAAQQGVKNIGRLRSSQLNTEITARKAAGKHNLRDFFGGQN